MLEHPDITRVNLYGYPTIKPETDPYDQLEYEDEHNKEMEESE